ncbi:hypothetical protein MMC21_000583 [Puttea exsequens]|nr:hypothetical protein [Puttea exsequens]
MDSAVASVPAKFSTLDLSTSPQPFRFFDLPSELRSKILSYLLTLDSVIDLHPTNYRAAHKRLALFLASKRLHLEASTLFYSTHTFRILPTHGRFFSPRTIPLPMRLPLRYRAALTSLELRLGPGWSNPPKSWRVTDALGLEQMDAVRRLRVFVECDPSHEIFRGFRIGKDFFTEFSGGLLEGVLEKLPVVETVEFEAWPSVMWEGPLMKSLRRIARGKGKRVAETGMVNGEHEGGVVQQSLYVPGRVRPWLGVPQGV